MGADGPACEQLSAVRLGNWKNKPGQGGHWCSTRMSPSPSFSAPAGRCCAGTFTHCSPASLRPRASSYTSRAPALRRLETFFLLFCLSSSSLPQPATLSDPNCLVLVLFHPHIRFLKVCSSYEVASGEGLGAGIGGVAKLHPLLCTDRYAPRWCTYRISAKQCFYEALLTAS